MVPAAMMAPLNIGRGISRGGGELQGVGAIGILIDRLLGAIGQRDGGTNGLAAGTGRAG